MSEIQEALDARDALKVLRILNEHKCALDWAKITLEDIQGNAFAAPEVKRYAQEQVRELKALVAEDEAALRSPAQETL